VVFGDKMFLFGGSNLETENRKFFILDLITFKWEVVKSRGDLPITRDEHSAVINDNDHTMIIFGGFADGQRTNELIKYHFQENKWGKIEIPAGQPKPEPRSGHTAVIYQNGMYIFGGKDDENKKLNDFWRLDLQTFAWTEVKLSSPNAEVPMPRSGHQCDVYNHYMVLFGGIFEITKELNDFMLYDFNANKWVTLFEESASPKKLPSDMSFEESSPHERSPKKGGSPI
jgi:N-acetylneuraminic acid mutarotase